jgi:hypothetical protein
VYDTVAVRPSWSWTVSLVSRSKSSYVRPVTRRSEVALCVAGVVGA